MEDEESFTAVAEDEQMEADPAPGSLEEHVANVEGEDVSDVEEGELQEPSQFEEEDEEDGS